MLVWFAIGLLAGAIQLTPLRLFTFTPNGIQWSDWTGFGDSQTESTSEERDSQGNITKTVTTITTQSGKTLWDLLSVLVVPLSLALLGFWFQQQQQKRASEQAELERDRADQQAKLERDIAEINQREEALQTYFDRLSDLLVDKNLIAIATRETIASEDKELLDAAVNIIRTRTLTILARFTKDARRKRAVMQFLIEAEVIRKLKLNLSGANLSGADLGNVNLMEANLSEANLIGANLSEANLIAANLGESNLNGANLSGIYLIAANLMGAKLISANLSEADLSKADLLAADLADTNLSRANLNRADLVHADLVHANLSGAKLVGANLISANLSGANLSGADLSGVEGWTKEQLDVALLCKTVLPEGCVLDPNRDCQKLASRRVVSI